LRCAGVVLNGRDQDVASIAAGMAADFSGLRVAVSVNQKDTSVNKFYTNWRLSGSLPR